MVAGDVPTSVMVSYRCADTWKKACGRNRGWCFWTARRSPRARRWRDCYGPGTLTAAADHVTVLDQALASLRSPLPGLGDPGSPDL